MFCIYCGKEIPDNSTFCSYCGKQITEKENNDKIEENKSNVNIVKESTQDGQPKETSKKNNLGMWIGIFAAGIGVLVLFLGGFIIWSVNAFRQLHPDGNVVATESVDSESVMTASNNRPTFLSSEETVSVKADLNPSVEDYEVEGDFNNIAESDRYYIEGEIESKLKKNLFVVMQGGDDEFFTHYESNRYAEVPNFVTVDSLMHTYHLYFAYLLKNTEKNYLYDNLIDLSAELLKESENQYEDLKGSEWEESALNNLAFFAIGAYLLDDDTDIPSAVSDIADEELAKIMKAEGIEKCILTDEDEDYTQYIPRGYYEGDSQLESYFRAMMWYGRIPFELKEEGTNRSALLMTLAMRDSDLSKWESAYEITSFFAGASDDLGYYEYMPIIEAVYGKDISVKDLVGKDSKWEKFNKQTKNLNPPQINSIPIEDGEDNVISSFRFMGQRFSIDADVMQQLVYSNVKENSQNEVRMLPDVLDVACALGSDTAEELLREQGDFDYKNYESNMTKIKEKYEKAPTSVWKSSLYSSWLYTLTPLLENAKDGYPSYMKSNEWNKKNLETFAGSYTELKHDTVLYSKQIMAEMGGGDMEEYDDRGYVDPQVEVYARFANLSRQTMNGLDHFDMISKSDKENLEKLAELAEKLLVISEKELENEVLSDEEYDLIRNYGGNIEHFWKDAMVGITGNENANPEEFPAALVTDIATDPNGQVLEIATGRVSNIMVIAPVAGKYKICTGSVYSFYQFPWEMSDRLTDSSWRQLMGMELNDDGEYNWDSEMEQPSWTQSYRASWQ